MSLPVDFMERVVEWPGEQSPGYINMHWQAPPEKGPGMRGRPFTNLHEFMDFVQYAATKPGTYKEIFFCLSTQSKTGRVVHQRATAHRHADTAVALKALWIDVDVKPAQPDKAYPNLGTALDAIKKFVDDAALPPPSAFVFSGGGVHVYWFSHSKLTLAQWKPYAEGLKAEALRLGLKCDAGVTADAARVLRVPGTFNNKIVGQPRAVKLMHLGDGYDFAAAPGLAGLPAKAPVRAVTGAVTKPAGPAFTLPAAFSGGMHPLLVGALDPADVLGSGLNKGGSDLPLDPKELFAGCQHFQNSFKTKGALDPQGRWMLNALACTSLDEGREIFHVLSKGYPTYSPGETDKMFDRKLIEKADRDLGWPSCAAFEGEGANCKTCPFYGKLRSPLNLCERTKPPVLAPDMGPEAQQANEDVDLPEDYVMNSKGQICEIVAKMLKDGTEVTEHVPLFLSKLRNLDAWGGGARQFVFETSLDMGRWGRVTINESTDLINDTTILKALRSFGVKPNGKMPNNARRIINFMDSFMDRLDAAKKRQQTTAFGWLYTDATGAMPQGFAYGGQMMLNDNTIRPAGYTDSYIETQYKPKGSDEPWWKLLHMVTAQHHPALEVLIAASFGAPLQFATGQYNGILAAWSNEGGAHKSTSIAIGAAIWGNPKLTKERPLSTTKGAIRRIGYIKNLPVYWDEIDSEDKMAEIAKVLSVVTEGSSGSRLKSDRTFHDLEEWQTLLMVGANTSLLQTVLSVVKNTDARLHRAFEMKVEKRGDTMKHHEVDALVNSLNHNYGQIGELYRDFLGKNAPAIDAYVKAQLDRFCAQVEAKSEERFRCAMAAAIYCGAVFGNKLGCDFNVDEIWDYLIEQFLAQRDLIQKSNVVAGSPLNVLGLYTQFIKAHQENILHVSTMPGTGATVWLAGPNKQHPKPIHIRMDVGHRIIDVSKQAMVDWLMKNKLTASAIVTGLKQHWGAMEGPRTNLATGSGMLGGGREATLRIPVTPEGPFASDLWAPVPRDQLPADYLAALEAPVSPEPVAPVLGGKSRYRGGNAITKALTQATADLDKVKASS